MSNYRCGSNQVIFLAANTTYTVISVIAQTINTPDNAVDIVIHFDGLPITQARQKEIVTSNTASVA
jgi:hypothetical protein